MKKTIRCGEYPGAVRARQREIDFNLVVAAERAPARRRQPLRMLDVYRLLSTDMSVRFFEQLKLVAVLALFLARFELIVLNRTHV